MLRSLFGASASRRRRVRRVRAKRRRAAPELLFTFDDGPAVDKTPKILDALDQHGIKAVFFVIGVHLQGNSAAAENRASSLREELRARPRRRQSHHPSLLFVRPLLHQAGRRRRSKATPSSSRRRSASAPICSARPTARTASAQGAARRRSASSPIGWDIDPQDWRLRNAPKIEAYVEKHLRTLHGRDILLLHDVQARDGGGAAAHPRLDRPGERARASAAGQPPIKIINYAYLLPQRKLVPPFLDALGARARRARQHAVAVADPPVARLGPAACLASGPGVASPSPAGATPMFILPRGLPRRS